MNRDATGLLTLLVALALLAVVGVQTYGALRDSDALGAGGAARPRRPDDPYVALDRWLAVQTPPVQPASLRDPFAFGPAPAPVAAAPRVRKHAPPPPEPKPVLTAIVFDADPRAVLHWKDRDWTVRSGALFDEFQVLGITRDQVTLQRGAETIILQRKPQGE